MFQPSDWALVVDGATFAPVYAPDGKPELESGEWVVSWHPCQEEAYGAGLAYEALNSGGLR